MKLGVELTRVSYEYPPLLDLKKFSSNFGPLVVPESDLESRRQILKFPGPSNQFPAKAMVFWTQSQHDYEEGGASEDAYILPIINIPISHTSSPLQSSSALRVLQILPHHHLLRIRNDLDQVKINAYFPKGKLIYKKSDPDTVQAIVIPGSKISLLEKITNVGICVIPDGSVNTNIYAPPEEGVFKLNNYRIYDLPKAHIILSDEDSPTLRPQAYRPEEDQHRCLLQ